MSNEKVVLRTQKWLNPIEHYDNGAICLDVSYYPSENPPYASIEAHMDIWDCSRKISLSFTASSRKELRQRLKKADLLIKHLKKMKKALRKAGKDQWSKKKMRKWKKAQEKQKKQGKPKLV